MPSFTAQKVYTCMVDKNKTCPNAPANLQYKPKSSFVKLRPRVLK